MNALATAPPNVVRRRHCSERQQIVDQPRNNKPSLLSVHLLLKTWPQDVAACHQCYSVSVFLWYTFQLKETHTHTTSLASTYNLLTSAGFSCVPSAPGTKTRPTSFIKPKGKTQLNFFVFPRYDHRIALFLFLLSFVCILNIHILPVLPSILFLYFLCSCLLFQSICRTFPVFFPFHQRFMRHGWMISVLSSQS